MENDDFFPDDLEDNADDWAAVDDEIDRLREDSARGADVFSDMEMSEESSSGGLFASMSGFQRLILFLMLLAIVIVYGVTSVMLVTAL